MPQLSEMVGEMLEGVIRAVHRSEARHLEAQIDALERLAGSQPGTAELRSLLESGYLPDYFIGTEVHLTAQLTMSTARERTHSAGGGIGFGPLRIEGGLSNGFRQGTQTNLSVDLTLVRQSRNQGLAYALTALSGGPASAGGTG